MSIESAMILLISKDDRHPVSRDVHGNITFSFLRYRINSLTSLYHLCGSVYLTRWHTLTHALSPTFNTFGPLSVHPIKFTAIPLVKT